MPDTRSPTLGLSYFGNRYLTHAAADLREMADLGVDFVVHVLSEADLRWNPGTMTELAALTRESGVEPWLTPWGLGGVFGGESASYAVGEHPEACQRSSDGRHLAALCPRQPRFRGLIDQWLDAAAAAGATVVQWDELHLALPYRTAPERWACRCDACMTAFREDFGEPMPESATAEVVAFLDELMLQTLTWMVAAASARGMESAIVLLANDDYDPDMWRAAAALPGVRCFGTTAFWYYYGIPETGMAAYLSLWAERMAEATVGTEVQSMGWVQAFRVPAEREVEIPRAVDLLLGAGVSTIAVWSYLACAAMSGLAPDRPDATWDAVKRAFTRVATQRAGRD